MAPKKILAVDDSRTYLHELSRLLRAEGYDVVMVTSGEDALQVVAVEPVDCILLDLVMPGIGGQETCQRIKAAPGMRDVPLIMLTGLEDRETMLDALAAGADDYIPKSGAAEVLTARVRAQLRRKQFEDENRHIREELLRTEIEATEARAARALAEARAAHADELERKNRELEAFTYSVSHDLKAPLRHIDGFSSILLTSYADELGDKGRDLLQRVRESALRMGELIEDLLELSRIDRAQLVSEPVDLSEIARGVGADLRAREPDRRVDLHVEDRLVVDADRRLITIVLENLIGNAWKFTQRTDDARIEVARNGSDGAAVVVRDNGPGFDMHRAHKLFEPFQRLHPESEFPGTGIGLATVHRIIDRHGGRIWAHSGEGRGATFSFTLPAAAAADRNGSPP